MMKLVTLTSATAKRFGIIKSLEMIVEAGFDGFDYSMFNREWEYLQKDNYTEYVKKIKEKSKRLALPCLQVHTPCPKVPNMISAEEYIPMTVRALEVAAELECPIAVVHPANIYTPEQNCELIYSKLLPTAERLGVIIATENMFGWNKDKTGFIPEACGTVADFNENLDLLPSPYYKACVDIGHAQMKGCEGAVTLLKGLGKEKIGALHVHDNDLVNDDHTFPFVGESNWEEITSALAEIGYRGSFTFEADEFMARYPDELIASCLRLLHDTGRYLINQVESKRK